MRLHRIFFVAALIFLIGYFSGAISPPVRAAAAGESPNPPPGPSQIWIPFIAQANSPGLNGLVVSGLQVITPEVGIYEKFEVHFSLATVASDPSLPFDPDPPAGIQPGIGASVDGLFSVDNWQTTLVQPGFFLQPYTYTVHYNHDHFTPDGPPLWAVRFAPQQTGTWQYRLRLKDASGTRYYPALNRPAQTFTVSQTASKAAKPYVQHGFLRVSPQDPRYFEFQDGTPFVGVGFNDRFKDISAVEQKMQAYEQNKMDFMRVWLSEAGINGSQWTSWGSHHLPNNGYLPGVQFDIQNTYEGADVSFRLDDKNPCLFGDIWQGGIPVEPKTTYRISVRLKLEDIQGPAKPGEYGFVVKQATWLGKDCDQPGNGALIAGPLVGDTDWITANGTYTTRPGQYWLDYLYLARQNATAGKVFIDEVRVWREDDPNQINLLREPNPNSHLTFDPMNAAQWDCFIQAAEQHGVYLKLVVDEKNEWIRNHIGLDGKMTPTGSNDNFYAAPGTKGRWLQEAWWRYLIARWGYSTAIHSFEYVNEGDPYDEHHYEAASAMARYFHANDPSRHMVTTSFWTSFPNQEFWSNPQFRPDLDYADLHAYISTGWGKDASFLDASQVERRPSYVHSGDASARIEAATPLKQAITPRGMVIRGAGEWILRYWMKADGFLASCPPGSKGGMQRLRWQVDGGAGGQEGVVPAGLTGDFLCTSPGGTFGWTQFRSDQDREGHPLPLEARLILRDDSPHEISLILENRNGIAGSAWIDDVELVSPWGEVVPVVGQFDINPMDKDTAWYNRAYGALYGGSSSAGAGMPLVRGETGVDFPDKQEWNPDLLLDKQGIWLHNNLWGQVNPGGMYDLFFWAEQTIPERIYNNYLIFRSFMEDIPLNNGIYRDAAAQSSDPNLRVWGQRDDLHGHLHLWIQNIQHTWERVIHGPAIPAISGTVTIQNIPEGTYRIEWWDTYQVDTPIFLVQTVTVQGNLVLSLPRPLSDDVAVKIERMP